MLSPQDERLAHYVKLATAAKTPEEASQVCMDAAADPHLFVFAELLNTTSITSLQATSADKYHRLLRLFAHGTVSDYLTNLSSLPTLSEPHLSKLRLLTLLTLARDRSSIPYDALRSVLSVDSDATVETVVRHAVYAGLLRARIDQRQRLVQVSSAVGRDVCAPSDVTDMSVFLRSWLDRSDALVQQIDNRIHFIRRHTSEAARRKAHIAAQADLVRHHVKNNTLRRSSNFNADHSDIHHDFEHLLHPYVSSSSSADRPASTSASHRHPANR